MNAQAKHTPGPWRVGQSGGVIDRRGCAVAKVEDMPGQDSGEVAANATLISAAPEMAAALLALVDTANAHCPVDHPALPLARNILRKAGLLS